MPVVPANIITPHSSVEYNDGEGLVHTDLNAQQAQMNARFTDVLGSGLNSSGDYPSIVASISSTSTLFVPKAGQAYLSPGAGLTLNMASGWIGQKNPLFSTFDGTNPELIMARVELGAGPHFTLDAADVVNPRIDLVQVRLSEVANSSISRDFKDAVTGFLTTQVQNKSKSVQVEFSIKVGTPAASPVAPVVDAGWALMAKITVQANATVVATPDLLDMRMPMKTYTYRMNHTALGLHQPGVAWDVVTADRASKLDNSLNKALAFCPAGFSNMRVIGVFLNAVIAGNDSSAKLVSYTDSVAVSTVVEDMTSTLVPGGGLFGLAYTAVNPQRPIWSNVYGVHENLTDSVGFPVSHSLFRRVALEIGGGSGSEVFEVGFVMAGDL